MTFLGVSLVAGPFRGYVQGVGTTPDMDEKGAGYPLLLTASGGLIHTIGKRAVRILLECILVC